MTERGPAARGLASAAFIVWGPPHKGPRSEALARELGITQLLYTAASWRPGLRGQPLKYPSHLWRTARHLLRCRPRVIFVQSPPTLAVWTVALYAAVRRGRFVVDAHSDAFRRQRWTRPRWLNRLAARRAALTLVTDEYWAAELRAAGAAVLVVPDVPTDYSAATGRHPGLAAGGLNVAVVNTWAFDEPLDAILDAAASLPEVTFHVTGRLDDREHIIRHAPPNVRFTGFLSRPEYLRLLASCDGVMCLTTHDHTMQRGACEALSLAVPIITSDWPLLRDYFSAGTVHVDNTSGGIADGIRRLAADREGYRAEISALRDRRRAEWTERRAAIRELLTAATE